MNNHVLCLEDLEMVTGGCGNHVGLVTPLGEYPAEDLIEMYNRDPQGAESYISLAKTFFPELVDAFLNECEVKGLTVPTGLMAML